MKARSSFRVQGEGKAQLITRMLIHSIQTHTTRHTYVQTFTHTHTQNSLCHQRTDPKEERYGSG